jgi:hypothetical protein
MAFGAVGGASLTLDAIGPRRLDVLHVLRAHFGWSLAETLERVASLPVPLLSDDPPAYVAELNKALSRAGAITRHEVTAVEVVREALVRMGQSAAHLKEPTPHPPAWDDAPFAQPLEESDVLQMIEHHAHASRGEELWLRISAWHLSNMPYRQGGADWVVFGLRDPRHAKNLAVLLDMRDGDPPLDVLTKVEIARELGQHEHANRILDELSGLQPPFAKALRQLIAARDERIVVVPPGSR